MGWRVATSRDDDGQYDGKVSERLDDEERKLKRGATGADRRRVNEKHCLILLVYKKIFFQQTVFFNNLN